MLNSRKKFAFSLIELLVVVAIISILVGLLIPAVQKVRYHALNLKCKNNLKQIGLSLHSYHDSKGVFPPGLSVMHDNQKYPFLGWTAYILPYIEQQNLYRAVENAFASDISPWVFYGHVPHHRILGTPVLLYNCPLDPRLPGPQRGDVEGKNQNLKDGMLFKDSSMNFASVLDGSSNTIFVGERPPSADLRLGWWYRGWGQSQEGSAEMLLGSNEINTTLSQCPNSPSYFQSGTITNQCDVLHFWSLHPSGANFLFVDGSARFINYSIGNRLAVLATRAGGEVESFE
jgi:prepilin-type N-terminal cleavage/methylation domain-containing protein/prepilin-type processing-associated H-X9-DG protein